MRLSLGSGERRADAAGAGLAFGAGARRAGATAELAFGAGHGPRDGSVTEGPSRERLRGVRRGGSALLVALALAGCPGPGVDDETGGSSSSSASDDGSSGEGPDLCAEVTCGAAATCDAYDGRCYCDPGHHGDPDVACTTYPDHCGDAEALLGHGVCVYEIHDEATWIDRSQAGVEAMGLRRLGKFLAPIKPSAPLPTLFTDRSQYNLHLCMLQEAFQDVLPMFMNPDYLELVYYRASRTMIAGSVYELVKDDLPVRYVFTVEVPEDTFELLRQDEVYSVYRVVQDRFTLGELGYFPRNAAQQGSALTWEDPGMPVLFNTGAQEPMPQKCL